MSWPFQVPMNDNSLFISFLRTPSSGNEILGRFEILGFVNFSRKQCVRRLQLRKQTQAAKRARQAEKRRIYNKPRKSEIKTRMKKVLIIHSCKEDYV